MRFLIANIKCTECKGQMRIRQNATSGSPSATMPYTIRCAKCKRWYDISMAKKNRLTL